jgi:hypothetical protein
MSIHRLPSGNFRARLMIDGVRYTTTVASLDEARDWLAVTRAQVVTGGLPRRITMREYAARWMTTYDTAPTPTRNFHRGNFDRHILPALGTRPLGEVTPTEIARLINHVGAAVLVATADAVYRTCSALFNAAVADDITLRSPVRSKKHRPRRQRTPHVMLEHHQAPSPPPARRAHRLAPSLVGLTATPKDEVDKNTYDLFDLGTGVPTDAYSLDEAVQDGFLVPPQGISVDLGFLRRGIKYDESEEEKDDWDELEWGEGEDGNPLAPPDEVDAAAINKFLFNAATVEKVLEGRGSWSPRAWAATRRSRWPASGPATSATSSARSSASTGPLPRRP